ncbi:MAG: class I SAM-dependent methyltransferase [Sphingomonadaceae bacterium]
MSAALREQSLADRLARAISLGGPIPVAHFMATANTHYYATRDPLGRAGDFITAPEISQMFGELIGLWLADLWFRMETPAAHYVELGPGRGTLARDALRAMAMVGLTPPVHFVETSPVLSGLQREAVSDALFHTDMSTLPDDVPLFVVANEFFDALPVHQLIKHEGMWHQRLIGCQDDAFVPMIGNPVPVDIIPDTLRDSPDASVIESSPACVAIMRALTERIVRQGGVMLIIDYGYKGPAIGDTLQAVKTHQVANPFTNPGEQDLTAHVDFETLAAACELGGARVLGPVGQGQWLTRLGLAERTVALIAVSPDRADDFAGQRDRLASGNGMGDLFKVMAVTAPSWPEPDGFG